MCFFRVTAKNGLINGILLEDGVDMELLSILIARWKRLVEENWFVALADAPEIVVFPKKSRKDVKNALYARTKKMNKKLFRNFFKPACVTFIT